MPRYMIERTFEDGLKIPVNDEGVRLCRAVVESNTEDFVTSDPILRQRRQEQDLLRLRRPLA